VVWLDNNLVQKLSFTIFDLLKFELKRNCKVLFKLIDSFSDKQITPFFYVEETKSYQLVELQDYW
jgi:hypothetical protein